MSMGAKYSLTESLENKYNRAYRITIGASLPHYIVVGDGKECKVNPTWLKLVKDILGYDLSDITYEDMKKYDDAVYNDTLKLQKILQDMRKELGRC